MKVCIVFLLPVVNIFLIFNFILYSLFLKDYTICIWSIKSKTLKIILPIILSLYWLKNCSLSCIDYNFPFSNALVLLWLFILYTLHGSYYLTSYPIEPHILIFFHLWHNKYWSASKEIHSLEIIAYNYRIN